MIGTTSPTCTGTIGSVPINVVACVFSGISLQVTVLYTFTGGVDSTSNLRITISGFRNPIST